MISKVPERIIGKLTSQQAGSACTSWMFGSNHPGQLRIASPHWTAHCLHHPSPGRGTIQTVVSQISASGQQHAHCDKDSEGYHDNLTVTC